MVILLILIIGTVTGYNLKCPAKAEWRLRANISCYSESKYVCLFHILEEKYEESCLGSDQSSIGSKLVFQPLFNLAECNTDRYQPVVFTTHGNSECILIKSKCTGEGQVVYSNGSYSIDTVCRCDYTRGYAFVSRPNNTCFCKPSTEDCSCFRVKCSNLSSDYQCITDGDIKAKTPCQEIHQQVSLNKDNLTVQRIDSNTHSDMRVSDAHQVSIIIIVTVAVSIALLVITVLKCYVFVAPTILSQETITYDQGGKTTVLKCYVRSYLPLKSAVWCRLLPNNVWFDEKSSTVSNSKIKRTIIFEPSEELESATYKCKASNIAGAVESPHVKLNEKENDEPPASATPSSSTNDDIPKDIHELFRKEECGKHYFARVILIGKNGVGKTSLMRRLLWGSKDQSSFTQSTDGIDIKKCNIDIKDGNWSSCNKVDHDLARLIQQMCTDKKKNKNEALEQNIEYSSLGQSNSSYSSDDSKACINQALVLQKKMTNGDQMEVSTQSCHDITVPVEVHESRFNDGTSNMTEDSSDIDDTSVDEIKRENTNCIIHDSDENVKTKESEPGQDKGKTDQFKRFEGSSMKSNEVENETGLQDDENIVQMINSIMQSCFFRNANDSHDMSAFCALWDFAGQKDFYATHQVFLSKCAVFLLVTDNLESSRAEKLWIDFQGTAQYVRFWFDTIHCYWSNPRENRLDPPIIVVCTNEDKIKDPNKRVERQNKFKKNLIKILNKQQKEHLRNIHFVSNTEDDDFVFQKIRKEISRHAMTMKDWGRDCPLKWLLFQQVVARLKDSQVPIAKTAELLLLAQHNSIGIHNDEEFKRCLQYFHDMGTVIYFDEDNLKDHVILNSKWLIDAFRCLVSDKIEFSIEISNDWQLLKATGELTSQIIYLLFKKVPKLKFFENKTHLIEVMKRFDIIVQLIGSKALYMPCMMEACSFNEVKKKLMNESQLVNITSWFCLEFEFLPPAFFNHIRAWYIKKYPVSDIWEKETRTDRKALYRQIGVFDFDHSRCQQLVVCEGPNVIALQIWDTRMSGQSFGDLVTSLFEFIETIENRYNLKISYEISFKCNYGDFNTNRKKMNTLITEDYRCVEHSTNHESADLVKPWGFMNELQRLKELEADKEQIKKKERDWDIS